MTCPSGRSMPATWHEVVAFLGSLPLFHSRVFQGEGRAVLRRGRALLVLLGSALSILRVPYCDSGRPRTAAHRRVSPCHPRPTVSLHVLRKQGHHSGPCYAARQGSTQAPIGEQGAPLVSIPCPRLSSAQHQPPPAERDKDSTFSKMTRAILAYPLTELVCMLHISALLS